MSESQDFMETVPCENFIDSDLVDVIKELSYGHEIAIILSSNFSLVNGFYSTDCPEIPTYLPSIKFKGRHYWAENIAGDMAKRDYLKLQELAPYTLFESEEPTDQGSTFRLLIASDINDENKIEISKLIEYAWKERTGYCLNLV